MALFLATLVLVSSALRSTLDLPLETTPSIKLETLGQRAEHPQVVFIGSSQVYRSIDPAAFEEELAQRGHTLRAFNLGADGMRAFEHRYVLQELAGLASDELQWVIIDLERLDWEPEVENASSDRTIRWHDLRSTWLACRALWEMDASASDKLEFTRLHLVPFAARTLSLGHGRNWVRETWLSWKGPRMGVPYEPSWVRRQADLGPAGDGFVPYDLSVEGSVDERASTRRAEFLADLPNYANHVLSLIEDNALTVEPDEASVTGALVADLVEAVEALDARAVFVISPGVLPRHDLAVAEPLLRFNDPERYPELYRPAVRWDGLHLTREGARLYTELLAARFAEDVLEAGTP